MLHAVNYNDWSDRATVAAKSFIGGDVIAILLRQTIRLRALQQYADFKIRSQNMRPTNIRNPLHYLTNIPISTIQQEAYTFQSDATRYPIESGAILSDHVILQPIRVDLSFEVSNWENNTAKEALDAIENAWRYREPVDLITSQRLIKNVVMVNFNGSNSLPEWGKIAARVTFHQVGLANLEASTDVKDFQPKENTGGPPQPLSAEPEKNAGTVRPKTRDTSVAYDASEWMWTGRD